MPEDKYPKPEVETIRKAIDQMGFPPMEETRTDRMAFQLGGLLLWLRPLDDLDLSGEEPATLFICQ